MRLQSSRVARYAAPTPEILGNSPDICRLIERIERVRCSNANVLITGENGTGKELVARALHHGGTRRDGPYVAINCAALPVPLLESELFGHARGAFTGANSEHAGLFVSADGGTLLLDEVGDMPLEVQVKLLRAIETRTVRPVGGNTEVPFDVRLVAASNQDLQSSVAAGRFREDLYFRLNVVEISVPPLRDRGDDVLLLAGHFLNAYGEKEDRPTWTLALDAGRRLLGYPWPGNVRELQNTMERAVAIAPVEILTEADLPERIRRHRPASPLVDSPDSAPLVSLAEAERRYILHVLERVSGNQSHAAKVLGVDRRTVHRKLDHWGLSHARSHSAPARPVQK